MVNQDLITTYSLPIIVSLILIEAAIASYKSIKLYHFKETITNVYLTALSLLCNLALRGFYIWIYSWAFTYRLFQIETVWLYWLVLLVFQDFLYYVLHCVDHFVRLFWAVHITHHSSTDYNISVGFRSSVFEAFFRFVYFIPLALVGFTALDIMAMYAILQIFGVLIHTKLIQKVPKFLGYIFVTPSFHRVHHGSNPLYLDKNMGMFLIIWDRLFGTFQEEMDNEPVIYGLTQNIENRNALNIIFHEFIAIFNDLRKSTTLKEKLNYVFKKPGWSHDNSSKTSSQLREEFYGSKNPKLKN